MPTFGEVKTRATGTGYAQLGVSLTNTVIDSSAYFCFFLHWYRYVSVYLLWESRYTLTERDWVETSGDLQSIQNWCPPDSNKFKRDHTYNDCKHMMVLYCISVACDTNTFFISLSCLVHWKNNLLMSLMQLDHWVHYEKPYQVQDVGPPYPSFELDIDQQRFWGRNYSHLEMSICFRYICRSW